MIGRLRILMVGFALVAAVPAAPQRAESAPPATVAPGPVSPPELTVAQELQVTAFHGCALAARRGSTTVLLASSIPRYG
jgi:hypothetical protein